ncbi:MAG: cellulase family glycosylhydrolase [Sedimentisphaerales bacterium]|jgi:aryl-phospho-beta-D-glucosidase BglC (GH1 family)
MNERLNALIVANVCLLMLPVVTFAQLPTPTYGWNLGNTLEPPCGEGCWGPAATQALINAVADAGFNTVRIPCAWDSHANQTTYVIDSTYMARVKQVVDWCYARNLYVIINCHWDGGWLENNITNDVNTTINAKQKAYWTQIANTFVNYDDHLLFAGSNEPGASTAAEMSTLLVYEQTFVNAVRATDGNNSTRWLLVQGPCTDIDLTDQLMNTLPTDSTPGRLMVEVHYYSPYNYVMMTSDQSWGNQFFYWGQGYHSTTDTAHNPTWGEEAYMDAEFQKMTAKFVNYGVPVLIGEFGAIKRTSQLSNANLDLHLRGRTYYHKTVVDYANNHGLKPVFWDIPGVTFNWTTGAEVDSYNINALTGGAALPPPSNNMTVSITLPSEGTTYTAPANITINATASVSGGTVTKVDFYQGTTLLGTDTTSPYSYTWNDVNVGRYSLTAWATDNNGGVGISTEVNVAVVNGDATGFILREWWTGLGSGTAVTDLTSDINYPTNPNGRALITSLEGPTNWADNYGTRIRGYLYPPADGNYTFWIAADDAGELWLSTDTDPNHKSKIAYTTSWTNAYQRNKYTSQQSSSISLVAGQSYYIEALHKEGTGGDNIAVAWQGPGITQQVIDGIYLSPYLYNFPDYSTFAGQWLKTNCNRSNAWCSGADRDRDGNVGLDDLMTFAQWWLLDTN